MGGRPGLEEGKEISLSSENLFLIDKKGAAGGETKKGLSIEGEGALRYQEGGWSRNKGTAPISGCSKKTLVGAGSTKERASHPLEKRNVGDLGAQEATKGVDRYCS